MKQFVLMLLCLGSMFVNAQQEQSATVSERISKNESKAAMRLMKPVPKLLSLTGNYDLKYHRLDFILDPAVAYIQGAVTSYFIPTAAGFNKMDFDLTNALTVDSVLLHGTSVPFSQAMTDVLEITFPATLPQGVLDSVTVFYGGYPPDDGLGSFVQSFHSNAPIVWTLSEPFGAKDWWPCKQTLNDKIDSLDIYITTANGFRAASNGLLVNVTQLNTNYKRYHWQTHYPIAAYLVGVAVTNYAAYTDYVTMSNGDSVPILNYIYPEDTVAAHSELPEIKKVIRLYDSLLIDYPFKKEKYDHAEFGWGGGMEHQTMSFVVGFYHELTAHECGHQWFGDRITTGSWQDIWLNEGFATYLEALTEEYIYPYEWPSWKAGTVSNVTSQPGGSVLCDDTTNINRIFSSRLTYNKGAYLLHMLRWELGDSSFFAGLRYYLNDPSLAYNYARTPDFINDMELSSGKDLTQFFNQWYYEQGYPEYQLTWNQVSDTFILMVQQQQSHPSASFFQMHIPVEVKGAGHDTIIVFNNTHSDQLFTAQVPFAITSVIFDPDLWILSANNSVAYNPTITFEHPYAAESQLYIYPNPTTSKVKIFSNAAVRLTAVSVYDMMGNFLSAHALPLSNGLPYELDVSDLPAGVYILNIATGTGTLRRQIIRLK